MANSATESTDQEQGSLTLVSPEEVDSFTMEAQDGTQTTLFPNDQLIASDAIAKFRKGIAALHSIPVSVDDNHTLNTQRLLDACATLVQVDFRKRPKEQVRQMRELESSPLFRVYKGELSKLAGIKGKNYERLEAAMQKLRDMPIRWNILGEDAKVEWQMECSFLSLVGRGKGKYAGMLCFAMDPRVLNMILEPNLWVTLSLNGVSHKLGTMPAYMLYQHAWRYIGTTNKVTADFPTATWIELLLGHSRHVKEDPKGVKEVVDYSDFKRRFLLPAIERINNIDALGHTLELKEYTSGRKVTRLQFKFIQKRQGKLDLPMGWPDPVVDALKKLGHTEDDVADLAQGFSLDQISDAIESYRKAASRLAAQGERINSPKKYFAGILSHVADQVELDDGALHAIERKARAEEAERRSQEDRERAQKEFAQHQTRRFMDNLAAWPDERRHQLISAFETSPEFAKARMLVAKGWDEAGYGAFALLRAWVQASQSDDQLELLPNPEDRNLEAWLLWRLSQTNESGAAAS